MVQAGDSPPDMTKFRTIALGHISVLDPGEDLSAYLLEQGWAVALPDAPFEYQTLEKIARSRGFGVWGTPVDNIQRR